MSEYRILFILINFYLCLFVFCENNSPFEYDINGVPAAFGDYDSDKFTDLFVIADNGQKLSILRGDIRYPYLIENKDWSCSFVNSNKFVVSVIPGDFRGKGSMDVVIVTRNVSKSDQLLYLYLLNGNATLNCDISKKEPFAVVKNHPLALDINGDMIVDLFAESSDGKRYFWLGHQDGLFNKHKITYEGVNPLKSPSSNAFVDLNGDQITDLIISGENYMELFLSPLVNLTGTIHIPYPSDYKIYGQSTFLDINADGIIDHLMPVCKDNKCDSSAILVWNSPNWEILAQNFRNSDNLSLSFELDRNIEPFLFPMKLRQTDVDGDGYPDLLALMRQNQKNPVYILQNIKNKSNTFGRSFIPKWQIENNLKSHVASLTAFIDLGENGKPDILIANRIVDGGSQKFKIQAIFNNQMIDACFLKVLVTSGLCYGQCPPAQSSPMLPNVNTVPYGTNQPGPSVMYHLVDADGNKRRGSAGQLSQSANFALQMPYSIFGLGEQPNFVEKLYASIPSGSKVARSQSWTQIVPDSQVVVIPYPISNPHKWRTKLFITPSDNVISTLIALIVICLFLVLIIVILHRKEVLEDLAEHQEYRRHWPESK